MQQVTVGTKYQIVIPKEIRDQIKGLKPGTKVIIKNIDNNIVTVKMAKKSWSDENYGKYKKYLKGAVEEIEEMRDEWDSK